MKTVRMIALRGQYYDRDLQTGDTFETTEAHAVLLERTGAAKRAPEDAAPKNKYKNRMLESEK